MVGTSKNEIHGLAYVVFTRLEAVEIFFTLIYKPYN